MPIRGKLINTWKIYKTNRYLRKSSLYEAGREEGTEF